jgi:hypothetical protein
VGWIVARLDLAQHRAGSPPPASGRGSEDG